MNYSGKFDAMLPADGAGLHSSGHGHVETFTQHATHAPAGAIIVPDAQLLFNGDFKRSGVDLVLSKDDRELVLQDYFKGEKHAALSSPDGAHLTGDIVDALTGHTQFAQADGSAGAGKVIGHVTKLAGTAIAIRNGVSIILNNGDNVEKGDVVQSGSNSTLGLTFIDGTVFGLSSNARMVLNEMVYDPNGSNNSSLLSLVSGTISFVAGETAKHGDMKVDTPVATMGIRGTAVLARIDFGVAVPDFDSPDFLKLPPPSGEFQIVVEPDGHTGSYILFDKTTLTPIATVNQAGQQINISNGQVSITNSPLSPELQKLIIDVFTLKFTDNSNTKTFDHYTDSLTPQSFVGIKLADGSFAPPIELNTKLADAPPPPPSNGPGLGTQRIPGPPDVRILDTSGHVASAFAITEIANTTNDGLPPPDSISFRVNWTDFNAGDVPTATATFASFTYKDAQGHDIAPNSQQRADILAVEPVTLEPHPGSGNNNNGFANFTYSFLDQNFDFLAEGEKLTFTYTVKVQNNFADNNEYTLLTITITITGTNDKPVITSSAPALAFTGDHEVVAGFLSATDPVTGQPAPTSGTLAFTDVDLTDSHTIKYGLVSPTDGIPPGPLAAFEAALTASIATDSTGTGNGTIHWQLAQLPDYLADFLPKGGSLTLTYAITITDSQGATSTQFVTVTITHTTSPDVAWIHPTGGSWETASNWETGTVPTSSDDVVIPDEQVIGGTGKYAVTITADAFAHSVTLNAENTTGAQLFNQSTLTVGDALTVLGDGVLNNSGTLSVGGKIELLDTSSLVNSSLVTLAQGGDFKGQSVTNSGTIDLTGGTLNIQSGVANADGVTKGNIIVEAAAKLTLTGATITGGTVTNSGEFDLIGTAELKDGSLGNSGQINVSGTGNVLDNENVTANHALEILAGGALLLDNDTAVDNSGGSITVDGTAALTLDDATITGGTVTNNVNGIIDITNSGGLNNGSLGNFGQINVGGTGNVLDNENVTANHALEVLAGGSLQLESTTVVNTGGTITVDGTATLTLEASTIGGGTLGNSGTLDSTGISFISNVGITNSGLIEATGGVLTIDPAAPVTLTNSGTLEANGGELDITNEPVTNTGTLQAINDSTLKLTTTTVTNTNGTVTVESGSTLDLAGATINGGKLGNSGQINVSGTGNALDNENVTANTSLEVLAGGALLLDLGTAVNNTGGTITVDGGATLTLNDAAISGGTLTNLGTVDIETASGATLDGVFVQNGSGNIEVDTPVLATTLVVDDGTTIKGGSVTVGTDGIFEVKTTLGATLDGAQVNNSGIVQVDAGSQLDLKGGATITGGSINVAGTGSVVGFGLISDGIANDGIIEAKGGTLDITGALSGAGSTLIDQGATLELGGLSAQDVKFTGAAATLKLDDPSHFTGNITGLVVGDVIEVATAANVTVTSATLAGGILTVTESNNHVLTFNVAGDLLENDFHINNLAGGGSDLTLSVDPLAETPSLLGPPTSVSGAEDSAILLNIVPALSADAANDPDSSLSLKISNIPADATLSNSNGNTLTVTNGSISFTAAQLAAGVLNGLAITAHSADEAGFTLHVTATNTDGTGGTASTASTSQDIGVRLTPVADAPSLVVSDASGTQDTAIGLSIAAALSADIDADSKLSLKISNIPADATLSNSNGDTLTVTNGSISFTAAQLAAGVLNGLSITAHSADEPNFTLTVTATNTDGTVSTPTSHDIVVTVNPAGDAPSLVVSNASGTEDTAIGLSIAAALTADVDPDSSLSLKISNIPADATLSNSNGDTLTVSNGSISFTAAQLAAGVLNGLSITAHSADEAGFTLHVTATNTDGTASTPTSHDIVVTVNPAADAPSLVVSNASGTEDTAIGLSIAAALTADIDPDSKLSLKISNIPADATLSNSNGDTLTVTNGSISFTAAQLAAGVLNGLSITAHSADEAGFTLHVTATNTDGTVSTPTSHDIVVTVNPAADAPSLVVSNASGTEDTAIGLSIAAALSADIDPDSSLSLKISNIPADATLSNSNGDTLTVTNGSISFTAAQLAAGVLNGLSITAHSADEAGFTLHVTATNTDGTVSTPTSHDIVVTVNPAEPFVWNGNGDGSSWSDANNWNNALVPVATDQVQINSNVTVTLVGSVEVSSLLLDNGATLTGGTLSIDSGGTLHIVHGTNGPGATLDGVSVSNLGTVQVDTAVIAPTSTLTLDDGTTVTGGAMKIGSSGVLDIQTGPSGQGANGSGGPDATLDGVTVTNDGNINVLTASGTILVLDDGTAITGGGTGTLTVNAGATLDIEAGTHGLVHGATLDGVIVKNSGTMQVDAANNPAPATLTLDDGTTVTGGGTLIVGNGSTLTLNNASVGSAITLAGTADTLNIDPSSKITGTVSGFANGDTIDFTAVTASETPTLGYDSTSGVLTLNYVVTDNIGQHTLHENITLAGSYTLSDFVLSDDGHGGTQVTENVPVINQGPQTASVADGGAWYATGKFTASDTIVGDPLTWNVVGGSHFTSGNYQFGIHEFNVVKTVGGTPTTLFDDTFNGTVPPAGPNILVGSSPSGTSYSTFGSSTYEQGNGEALIKGSNAGYVGTALGVNSYGDPVFGQFTTLLTGTSFNAPASDGLRSGQSFSTSGLFDLTTPSDGNTRYGIRLSDRSSITGTNGQPGTEIVDLGVIRNGNGTASVLLSELNHETGVSSTLQVATINLHHADDNEILLSLSNDAANNGVVHASYTLEHIVNGVEVADGGPVTLAAVGHIFDNEDWVRPQFYGFSVATTTSASAQADSILQGTYGQLDIAQDGTWHYHLNPGLASVKALAAGQTAQDNFTVTATNAAGAHSSQTVSVTVTGVNDAPVVSAPAEFFNAVAGTDLNLRAAGLSVSDADGGSSIETATLSVGEGIVTISAGDSGVTNVTGNGTGSVTFSGTIAQINALLNTSTGTVVYNDNAASPKTQVKLTLTVHDNGNNGGTDLSGTASSTIDVAPNGGFLDWHKEIDPFSATQGSSTKWIVHNSDGLTSTVFNGGGFTYDSTSHLPTGGGIASIQLVDNSNNAVLQSITNVPLQLGDFGNFIARVESIQSKIPWSSLVEASDNGPLSFSATDIRFANSDGTFTEIIGTNFAKSSGSQPTGTVTSVVQLDALGNVLQTASFGGGTSLGDVASAISGDNLSQQFYDLMAAGNANITGFHGSAALAPVLYLNLDDAPGNHIFTGQTGGGATGVTGVNFGDATSGVAVNLAAGTASWGGYNDTLHNITNVFGSKFVDTITGDANNNYLDGGGAPGGGHDTLTGGAGTNTFVFQQGYGAATITDFDQGSGTFSASQGDQIQLSNFASAPVVTYVPDGNTTDTVLTFSTGDVLTLLNVTQSEFIALGGSEFANNNGGNNNGPVISGANNTVTYTGTAVLLDQTIAVSDAAHPVTGVNVWISSGFQNGDTLSIGGNVDGDILDPDGSTIHYHYDNTISHSMSLSVTSGTATLADFDAALQSIRFSTTSGDPTASGADTSRTLTWAAHDSANATSLTVTTTVDVAPLLNSFTLAVAGGGTTLLSDSNFSITNQSPADFFSLKPGSVVGGEFRVYNGSNWVSAPTGGFTVADIEAGHVEFVQIGLAVPDFLIHVSDGNSASPDIAPTVLLNAQPWGSFAFPTVSSGVHVFAPNYQVNAFSDVISAGYYSTPNYDPVGDPTGPYTMTQNALPLDPFLLPEHAGSQIIQSALVTLPVRQAFILPNVDQSGSVKPEAIDAYVTQDNNGHYLINHVLITGGQGPNAPLTIGNATQIEDAGTATIEGLSESFRADTTVSGVPVLTTYDVVWDSYAGGVDTIKFQIFNADGTAASPVEVAATNSGFAKFTDTPAYSFHAGAGAYAFAEAVSSTATNSLLNLTGQTHDAVLFQGYNLDGSTNTAFNGNPFQPDLSHYQPGAVNHITQEAGGGQALQFLQTSTNNAFSYFIAWNELVVDSNGSHDQVELLVKKPGTSGLLTHQSFQIADGHAQNIRLVEWSDPAVAGQDFVVLAYGDGSATHLVEYSIHTTGGTTQVNEIAAATVATTTAYTGLVNFGDGRIGISYDHVIDANQTSQDQVTVYDFRTAGLNINYSALTDGQSKYVAGTHFNDTFTGENNDRDFYYFVGQHTSASAPTDHFNGGSNAWNEAIFADARSHYTVITANGVTTITNIDPLHAHAGQLVVDANVEALAFNSTHDPVPNADGSIEATGDTLLILGQFTNAAQIDAGATLEFAGADSGLVTFASATGTLRLDDPTSFTGKIAGIVGSGNVLDLGGFDAAHDTVVATSGSYNGDTNTTSLLVSDTTPGHVHSVTLQLVGDLHSSSWTVTGDGNGGANIVDPPGTANTGLGAVVAHDPGPAAGNTIVASTPNQALTGTDASDTFVFNFAGVGKDTVTDFHPGADALQFMAPMFANAQGALDATHDDGHGNTVVGIDAHDTITLAGILKAQLHAGDFHVV